MHEFDNKAVQETYATFPDSHHELLMRIRELVLEVADELELPGGIEETLKWGEPSYLPVKPRTGSTVRVGSFDESSVTLFFNCQTMLVERFRSMFGDRVAYSKNRALLFDTSASLPEDLIQECTRMALCYHLDENL